MEEADSEEDADADSVAEGDAEPTADAVREHRQQQDDRMMGDGGGGAVEVEGVEVIEGLLCRDDIAPPPPLRDEPTVSELSAMRKWHHRQMPIPLSLPSFLASYPTLPPFDILQ